MTSPKTALITGASKGLGKAMALAFADAGARLALVSRDAKLLAEVQAACRARGAEAEVYQVDVTSVAPTATFTGPDVQELLHSATIAVVAEVPLGAFLSGGVDSSAVVGTVQP